MKSVIFIAPPGAGKGTQSVKVSNYYNIPHISTGDLLREESKKNTEFGLYIKGKIDKGEFVSDEDVLTMLKARLNESDCNNGYILDGYPRNVNQAYNYEKLLQELGKDLGVVIYLNLPKEVALGRIIGRKICPNCGASYNVSSPEFAPKLENICDKCSSNLTVRADDNPETYEKRYETYMHETAPLIQFYQNKNILKTINISENMEAPDVFVEVKKIIEE